MPALQIAAVLLSTAALAGVVLLLKRRAPAPDLSPLEGRLVALAEALARSEQALRADAATLRGEIGVKLDAAFGAQLARLDQLGEASSTSLAQNRAELAAALERSANDTRERLAELQRQTAVALADARVAQNQQLADTASAQSRRLADFSAALAGLQKTLDNALAQTRAEFARNAADTRATLDKRLDALAAQNAEKLEQMRATVDEKLQTTLEKRLSENFKLVGENLEKVMRSLGEMQAVAADVGDLKRVLTNVKTRGTWGEFQLAAVLETLLLPDQYAANVRPVPRRDAVVEFAIKLPGRDDSGVPLWLPIDSKFPKEDYERIVAAAGRADADALARATADLARRVEGFARDIRDKYIAPPHTTDFAILFLPTEGLYAEILRVPGLADKIQRESRVLIAGPTILAALINSLQMGFRTLAIQKRSGEVWKLLGAIKAQFGSFGELLGKVQRKLDEAGRAVGDAADKHRVITNRLGKVETLPDAEAAQLLPGAPRSADPAETA